MTNICYMIELYVQDIKKQINSKLVGILQSRPARNTPRPAYNLLGRHIRAQVGI
jgi:hypothetical protein